MTEELAALTRALECVKCNGTGTLAWRLFAEANVIPCDKCGGTGLSRRAQLWQALQTKED